MERIVLYRIGDVIKGRLAGPHEVMKNPRQWKNIQFDVTDSPVMMITWPILLPEIEPESAQSLLDLIGARYPFSPRYHELKQLAPELTFSTSESEWIFFGGTFNPWHPGHQACLNLLPEDKICFILPDRSPHKELRTLEPVFTTISLISKIKFGKNHYLAPTFLLENEKNPTVRWMEKLHQECPDKKLSLLLGFDSFKNLPTWTESNKLIPLLSTVYVVSRLEDDEEREAALAPLQSISPNLQVVYLGRHGFEGISSTKLRKEK